MLEFQTFYFAKKSRRRSISSHYSISHKIYTGGPIFTYIQFKHINGDKYSVYGCQSKKLCRGLCSSATGTHKFPFSCVAGLGMPHRNFYCIISHTSLQTGHFYQTKYGQILFCITENGRCYERRDQFCRWERF